MKRRDFLKSTGAIATLPIIPALPALARATSVTAFAPETIARAVQWAGLWDESSAPLLKYRFDLSDTDADALFDHLVQTNVVAQPNSYGVARVLVSNLPNPFPANKLHDLLRGEIVTTVSKITTKQAKTVEPTEIPTQNKPVKRPDLEKAERFLTEKNTNLETTVDDEMPHTEEATDEP